MKQIKETKEVTKYKEKCPFCSKEIIGSTENQVNHLLLIHKIRLHPDKIDIKEKK